MCAPSHYDVDYVINPWMEGNLHRSSKALALEQWRRLCGLLQQRGRVELLEPQPGLPDLVFTANAAVVMGNTAVLARFFHPERQGEEPWFGRWFESQGFEVVQLPPDLPFEGAGDALLDRGGGWLWAGYGFRSELGAHPLLAQSLGVEVLSLRLIDERFYHLDTCLCPLSDGSLLYYPPAFDLASNRLIESRLPPDKRLAVSGADALAFACNAVNLGDAVLLNQASAGLRQQLEARGFTVLETPLGEFLKAGGAAKCLTLRLDEPRPITAADGAAPTPDQSRTVRLQGHPLDTGLINRALARIVEGGGSFQVLDVAFGQPRHSPASTAIRVTAPNGTVMADLIAQLVAMGAESANDGEPDLALATVEHAGWPPTTVM